MSQSVCFDWLSEAKDENLVKQIFIKPISSFNKSEF